MEANVIIPIGTSKGIGGLLTFNYFWYSPIGGFYLGGGIGYIWSKSESTRNDLWNGYVQTSGTLRHEEENLAAGLNVGYKFITRSGVYFRVGGFIGMSYLSEEDFTPHNYTLLDYKQGAQRKNRVSFYFKPELAFGYTFTGKR